MSAVHSSVFQRHLWKMVDSCRQLITVSQSNGDEDTAGMVTILTGHQVEQLCSQSTAMKVCLLLSYIYHAHGISVSIFSALFSCILIRAAAID